MHNQDLHTLSVQEVADLLGIHVVTCYNWIREGRIPSIRLGRSVRVRRSSLVDWMNHKES